MPDFTTLLRPRISETKRPPALPREIYPGIVKSYEYGESNQNKTPYVRYQLALTGWPPSIPASQRVTPDGDELDPSRRAMRRDFYLTTDAYYRLVEFIESCGIHIPQNPDGTVDLEAACPQVVGCQVQVEVQQYLNQQTNEIGNQVGRVFGASQGR